MIDNPLPDQVMQEKEALYVNEQFEEHCANTARKIAENNNYLGFDEDRIVFAAQCQAQQKFEQLPEPGDYEA